MDTMLINRPKSRGVLLFAGGIAGALFCISFSILSTVSPEYLAVRDTISSLEFTPLGILQRFNFGFFGLLQLGFGYAIFYELKDGRGSIGIPLFQLVCGLALIGDGIFIHDPLHLIFDLIAFNSTMIVLLQFAWRFWGDPVWNGWSWYSIGTAGAMIGWLTAFGFALHSGSHAGLYERLAVVTRSVWSVLFITRIFTGTNLRTGYSLKTGLTSR